MYLRPTALINIVVVIEFVVRLGRRVHVLYLVVTVCVVCFDVYRAAASGKSKQVGPAAGSSSSRGKGRTGSAPAAGPSPEEVARRREQLAAAAEARLKALQQKQQLWLVLTQCCMHSSQVRSTI